MAAQGLPPTIVARPVEPSPRAVELGLWLTNNCLACAVVNRCLLINRFATVSGVTGSADAATCFRKLAITSPGTQARS